VGGLSLYLILCPEGRIYNNTLNKFTHQRINSLIVKIISM